ncbi:MAG TPA: hypothetical protein VKV05_06150 [Terriglobales bacterium]|nr:hypothetical protein [Terriglobales bacterium]
MSRTLTSLAVFVFALTMSLAAFAASKSESIRLYNDTQLNGKTLPAGDYTVKYDATGSTAQVKFLKNGKEVASATGQVKHLVNPPDYNQVVTNSANGTSTISEIDFGHAKTGVTFGDSSSGMSAAGQ